MVRFLKDANFIHHELRACRLRVKVVDEGNNLYEKLLKKFMCDNKDKVKCLRGHGFQIRLTKWLKFISLTKWIVAEQSNRGVFDNVRTVST